MPITNDGQSIDVTGSRRTDFPLHTTGGQDIVKRVQFIEGGNDIVGDDTNPSF